MLAFILSLLPIYLSIVPSSRHVIDPPVTIITGLFSLVDQLIDETFNIEARQRYGIEEAPGEAMGYFSPILTAGNPKFFKLRAQLLDDGRDIVPLAETENLWTWIKVYASGGENVLHAH